MPLSRDQLVADWQSRLAAAEEFASGAAPRAAWLRRVQVRLYRFLLSLYGAGDWRATGDLDSPLVEIVHDKSLVFDSPEVLPLAGKPAKETGKIREVLKAVAGAQEQPLTVGPLVAGLPPQHWVVVAVVKSGVDPSRYVKMLRSRQFTVRVLTRGADLAVEVPAAEHRAALKLLLAQERRDLFDRRAAVQRLPAAIFWTLALAMFSPIPAFAALLFAHARYPDALAGSHTGEAALYALALFFAFCSIACVRPISRLVLAADRFVMHWSAILKQRLFPKR